MRLRATLGAFALAFTPGFNVANVGAVADQVRSYVRSNPGKALLISVGVGFLIGLLLRRDESEE